MCEGRDTVASVGLIMGRTLPFVNSNTSIKTFRHALSLDEVCVVGCAVWVRRRVNEEWPASSEIHAEQVPPPLAY